MQKEIFIQKFLQVFTVDTGLTVTLADVPERLDLDSLDLVELCLELENVFDNEEVVEGLDIYKFVQRPLQDLCDATYNYLQSIRRYT